MLKDVLPDYQGFLLSNKLIVEKKIPFYANWVSKFLAFSNNSGKLSSNLQMDKFLTDLKKYRNIEDWQIGQAKEALELYINHFLKNNKAGVQRVYSLERENPFSLEKIVNLMREAIRVKHYAYKTERSYIDWVRRFYEYIKEVKKGESIFETLTSQDVRNFLSYLAIHKQVASSTQNQAFNAILFLFRNILRKNLEDISNTVRAKRGPKLPVVLASEEVGRLLNYSEGINLLILKVLYGAGLRLMELVRLRVKDIDFNLNLIFVRSAKQDKDRSTILPELIKEDLFLHLEKVKETHENDLRAGHGEVYLPNALERKFRNAAKEWGWQYAFPSLSLSVDPRSGKVRRHHISEKSIQNAVRNASKKAKIIKHVTVHTLRHSFATHLLMDGVNIREIQELLGHKNVETTMIYTHVMRDMTKVPRSPLDNLYKDKRLVSNYE